MKTGYWWSVVVILFLVIIALTWLLVATPAPVQAPVVATSTPNQTATTTTPTPAPLHDRVIVTSPKSGATVGKTFTVKGEAPGNWYFEASFPIQVRDKDNNKIGQGIAQAQSDWMTTAQVPFIVTITITGNYTGPATLALIKDNPSGLPEHDDSIEIPIVIE